MLFNIPGLFSFISDLLPLVLLLVYWRITRSAAFAALFAWTIFSVLSDVAVTIYDDKADQIVAYVSIIVELMFISFLYFFISSRKKLRYVYLALAMIFVITGFVKLVISPPQGFDYLFASLCLLTVLILSLILLYEKFSQTHGSFLLANSLVWFPLAYVIYCSGNLFLFATSDHFTDVFGSVLPDAWIIFLIANIIKNMFFCKAIMLEKKKMHVVSSRNRKSAKGLIPGVVKRFKRPA